MLTAFGKELRKIRINHNEVLKNMADRLNVSSSFLSAVEVGKKNVPRDWCEKITIEYHLSGSESSRLLALAKDSVNSIKISLKQSNQLQRNAALVFARDFSSISDETAQKIINLVKTKK